MTTTMFEDEVRAMLTRRAADVPDAVAAEVPPLPTGLRIALDDHADRRPPGRARWLAAAVVALLAATAGLLVATDADPSTERAGPTDASATTVERPGYLATLPGGVDPTRGPVLPVGPPAATPEEARALVLEPVFGADINPPAPFTGGDEWPDDVWASWITPTGTVDPAVWTVEQATHADVGGSVTVRRTDEGWRVVAVTSVALDLTGVAYDGTRISGSVVVDAPAPLRVVVETLDGEQLATSDLTVAGGDPDSGRALDLADLDLGIGAGGAGAQPVVLRVFAGDRPGQVGLDGVDVAAYAAVALTPGAEPAALPSTTTEAPEPSPPPEAEGRALAPGDGVLWRAPVAAWGDDWAEAALGFGREVLGIDDAEALAPEGPVEPGYSVDVVLHLGSGTMLPIRLVRDGDTWTVLQVGGGTVEVDRGGEGMGFDVPDHGVASARDLVTVIRPDGTWERYGVGTTPLGLRPAAGWIVTVVDPDGRVLVATGNPA